ncbi:MAG: ribbon-helix-helix domain-containing protein [Actinobacteria bacterium]|nr:ribbon-helix-helix domain-containing protein [Actinomycetota bacterium]
MKRASIRLPDDLDLHLRQEARRRGVTLSELAREAIEAHLARTGGRRLHAAAAGASGERDVSERIEQILVEELAQ